MGDFNSRLARDNQARVGHWCIHKHQDSGGDRLTEIMNKLDMRCVSTYFQPRKNHNNATYMNKQPGKAPSQIDYVIVSSRWASSVRYCEVKWGIPITIYGRKYDHGMVKFGFKLRLKADRRNKRKDFKSLHKPETSKAHDESIKSLLTKDHKPQGATEKLKRLSKVMQSAQSVIPNKPKVCTRKWETSQATLNLLRERSEKWDKLTDEEKLEYRKDISRSARNDYRDYVNNIITDIESDIAAGQTSDIFRKAKSLSTRPKGSRFDQPSVDLDGNLITSSEQQLEAWAKFLEKKFSARADEPVVELGNDDDGSEVISLEEVTACVSKMKSGKATGPDEIPVEQYKASPAAVYELHDVLQEIWTTEEIPDEFTLADMQMLYKKKSKDDRKNYRALGLLNHCYKVFAMVLLMRMLPFIEPRISDMQAGFRKDRGCRDNIFILTSTIQHLLDQSSETARSLGIITYIDFTAAFDSILHSYLLNALKEYNVPSKYCRLVQAIYNSAKVRVKLQETSGNKIYSRPISIKRGVIQGDIPSPVCFLVSLDKLLKDHGNLQSCGIQLTPTLLISDIEYADDAALPDEDVDTSSRRLTHFAAKADEEAGMEISIPKTKAQHIMHNPPVSATTEEDIEHFNLNFKFKCDKCDMSYPTQHGLSVHKGRKFCKKRKNAKKPSRKGTVADRIVQKRKKEEQQKNYPKVKIGNDEIENVLNFEYLGADVPNDGDPEVPVVHRCNVAWGRFGQYAKTLMARSLPVAARVRLHRSLITSTMAHSCEAWQFTKRMQQKVNGVNSKMMSLITKNSIHHEAKYPTFDAVSYIKQLRHDFLGHILRMDPSRSLRRFTIELSCREAPFRAGSLLSETTFQDIDEAINAAQDRSEWRNIIRGRKDN